MLGSAAKAAEVVAKLKNRPATKANCLISLIHHPSSHKPKPSTGTQLVRYGESSTIWGENILHQILVYTRPCKPDFMRLRADRNACFWHVADMRAAQLYVR
jgi:hypothetical protein